MIEPIKVKVNQPVEVTRYKTSSGEKFDTEAEAIEHEALYMQHLDAKKRLRAKQFYSESFDMDLNICYLESQAHAEQAYQFSGAYHSRKLQLSAEQTPGWFTVEVVTDCDNDPCGYLFRQFNLDLFKAEMLGLLSEVETHVVAE